MQKWQCRVAPSLGGGFEGTPNQVWGVSNWIGLYNDDSASSDPLPTVFFGLYGLPDFFSLWRSKSVRKAILWAGSDIRHFRDGYWLDDKGDIRISPQPLARWIAENCESYVENKVEYDELKKLGIESKIVPSFLGNVDDFKLDYSPSDKPKLYTSVSGDDFALYGWQLIPNLARQNPDVEFHLYGNTKEPFTEKLDNVIVHGRVPKEQMNAETKTMQGALRLTSFDGFSEILAKSILWGQYPVSLIPYPYMLHPNELHKIKDMKDPNVEGREYYLSILNKYPWNLD